MSTSPTAAVTSRQNFNDEFGVWMLTLTAFTNVGTVECSVQLPSDATSEVVAKGLEVLAQRIRVQASGG